MSNPGTVVHQLVNTEGGQGETIQINQEYESYEILLTTRKIQKKKLLLINTSPVIEGFVCSDFFHAFLLS